MIPEFKEFYQAFIKFKRILSLVIQPNLELAIKQVLYSGLYINIKLLFFLLILRANNILLFIMYTLTLKLYL